MAEIPLRELRNDTSGVLRRVEDGEDGEDRGIGDGRTG
jgi:antitoxin (DNA-binding transcriptional repressor) of toxin-antitoxin stability system